MSIGAGGILRATLMLSLALGTTAACAQTAPNGAWTDPPARSTTPAAPPAAAIPAAPVTEPTASASRSADERAASSRSETAGKATAPASSPARQAAAPVRKRVREVRRTHPQVIAATPRARIATPRVVERREAARPVMRRVAARAYTPRTFSAPPYPYAPLPVGRVVGPGDGERNPIFAEGDDRMRRIAAAQAAGYLVVRSRSVQYPDGRMVRSYRPYDDDDGLD